jgi:hypothetical protein
MHRLLSRMCLSLAVITAFFLSGFFASSFEIFNSNLFTSTAVFGVSFVSIVSGTIKFWSDIFN